MDVYNPVGVVLEQGVGYVEQEACQYDEVNLMLTHDFVDFPFLEILCRQVHGRNLQVLCTADDAGLFLVCYNQRDFNRLVSLKISDDSFGIRPFTRCKNGYSFHCFSCFGAHKTKKCAKIVHLFARIFAQLIKCLHLCNRKENKIILFIN